VPPVHADGVRRATQLIGYPTPADRPHPATVMPRIA
jgi:hypothetical protein